jgi:hypothetical protein
MGPAPVPATDRQPDHQGQHQHVEDDVQHRQDPLDQGQGGVDRVRRGQEHTQASLPTPIEITVASIRLARSRPGLRARISTA